MATTIKTQHFEFYRRVLQTKAWHFTWGLSYKPSSCWNTQSCPKLLGTSWRYKASLWKKLMRKSVCNRFSILNRAIFQHTQIDGYRNKLFKLELYEEITLWPPSPRQITCYHRLKLPYKSTWTIFHTEWHNKLNKCSQSVRKAVLYWSCGAIDIRWYPQKPSRNEAVSCPITTVFRNSTVKCEGYGCLIKLVANLSTNLV